LSFGWNIGERIEGRWEVYNVLRGGVGVVYIVYDHKFREPFAAKTLRPEVLRLDPEIAQRFTDEALVWVNLDIHENVTRAHMVENVAGQPYLFLEYVSGGDLQGWIGTPRLMEDLPQSVRFAIHFCDGINHAFQKGIQAHRDIKPQNCLITQDGTLKVTDFGLAKALTTTPVGRAAARRWSSVISSIPVGTAGMAAGTCTHMAPEQFDDASRVDVRADIYSFGVMLHQMVTGELPFRADNWDDFERLHKTQPPPFTRSGADGPLAEPAHPLRLIVETCLAKDPERRFRDFAQVREWLAEVHKSITGTDAPHPAAGPQLGAVEWNNKGSSLDNLGRPQEAVACYDRAIEMDPKFADAWFNKGVSLLALKKPAEAVACYDRALELKPRFEQALSNKGVALRALGKVGEALACYERALQINPRHPDAWVNKGVALRAEGNLDEALACYTRALRLNPLDTRAWSNRGNILYALGQHAEALACYDRALEQNPRLDQTWFNKGLALMALGRRDEEVACYEHAVEINPRHAQAWFNRGVALLNVFRRFAEAQECFEQAKRLGVAEAAHAIGVCQQMLNPVASPPSADERKP
jgi:tetratricopeptide (TPR) repeat protein